MPARLPASQKAVPLSTLATANYLSSEPPYCVSMFPEGKDKHLPYFMERVQGNNSR